MAKRLVVYHKRPSGFGSEYKLRRSFAKQLGVLPTEYRERFG